MAESLDRATSADNDQSTLRTGHEWELTGGTRRVILCVETALELRPGFEASTPDSLKR